MPSANKSYRFNLVIQPWYFLINPKFIIKPGISLKHTKGIGAIDLDGLLINNPFLIYHSVEWADLLSGF